MFEQLLTISRNTFVESIRQPIFVTLVMVGILAMALNTELAGFTFQDDNKLLLDLGMSTLLLTCLALAAFTATSVVSIEIENKTVLTTVSKPVTRPIFILGKYLGVSSAIALAFWILAIVFFMTVRHRVMTTASDKLDGPVLAFSLVAAGIALVGATAMNYLYRWVFSATFVIWLAVLLTVAWGLVLVTDKHWDLQPITAEFNVPDSVFGQLHLALILIFEAVLIFTAIAVATSTRLGQVMTIVISISAFAATVLVASVLDYAQIQALWATALRHLVPNLQYLWHADALSGGNKLTAEHIALVSAYAMLFVTAILSLAVGLFQTREVG
jgi:hypothetical protein